MAHPSRVALVTGGSRGLGRSTVLALAEQGVSSILTYNAKANDAASVVAAAEAAGAKVIALRLNAGDVPSFDGFAGEVRDALSMLGAERLDYLVNNAGMSDGTAFEDVTEELLDLIYAVNFKGVFFLTQKLLPIVVDGGRIINISTGLTRFYSANRIPYASLKGAIEVFSFHLAKEAGIRGITVNTVAPGPIATDFSGGVVRDNPEVNKAIAGMTALGRAGEPDDVGPMIASLLTGGNRWVTAQRIEVSGGIHL